MAEPEPIQQTEASRGLNEESNEKGEWVHLNMKVRMICKEYSAEPSNVTKPFFNNPHQTFTS